MDALKHIGLKANSKTKLFNGPLECRFMGYDLFKGDHKSYATHKKNREE